MKTPSEADLLLVGKSLESLGGAVTRGEIPEPKAIVSAISSILLLLADVDDLKSWLNPSDAAKVDGFIDQDVESKLGPRP